MKLLINYLSNIALGRIVITESINTEPAYIVEIVIESKQESKFINISI